MLDNEFDQFFRDRLLDHTSKVRQGLWKQVQTHLVRHRAFFKWYFIGPSAVVVAVAVHFVLAALQSTSANRATPATSTTSTLASPAPATTATANPAAAPGTSVTALGTSVTAAPGMSVPAPGTSAGVSGAAGSTPGSLAPASGPRVAAPGSYHHSSQREAHSSGDPAGKYAHYPVGSHHGHVSGAHNPNEADGSNAGGSNGSNGAGSSNGASSSNGGSATSTNRFTGTPGSKDASSITSASRSNGSNGASSVTNPGSVTAHPPIPAQLTGPAKLVKLKTRPAITANAPNPKNPHQLRLPTRLPHGSASLHLDAFGSPEYFANKDFGIAYGGGARVTLVYKNHWTVTSGLEYRQINVLGNAKDSASWLFPGNIRNIHLPLLLGYTTGNDRFAFSANAGLLLNLYTQAGGQLSLKGNWNKRHGPSAYLGFNFSTRVTDRISIFAEPYLKCWYPTGAQQFQQLPDRLWSTGLTVGLRFNF